VISRTVSPIYVEHPALRIVFRMALELHERLVILFAVIAIVPSPGCLASGHHRVARPQMLTQLRPCIKAWDTSRANASDRHA